MPTPSPTSGIPLTLDALENRIDTTKTLDIFTMQPKVGFNKRNADSY